MRLVPITSKEQARRFKLLPVIAVDLGFSGHRPTTGVAWVLPSSTGAKKFGFGAAVEAVANLSDTLKDVVLVLESPLSAAFGPVGNPRPRGGFEVKPQARWWSVGSGAAAALSALFFLRELYSQLRTAGTTIHLVEGFVSGKASCDHMRVAVALRDGFRGERSCKWHSVANRGDVISALDWLDSKRTKLPPLIVQPLRV